MSTKNKTPKQKEASAGGGKKSKSKDKNAKKEIKLSRVEETFYQLTVADCEKKLNHLRKHLQSLEENNVAIKEQIRSLNEDKVDEAAVMTDKVNAANETIYIYNEKIYALSQEYFGVKSQGDATINDLEEKYKAMHDQLTAEIKLLKAHLNLLNEYPSIDMKLNYINELEEERKREKEQEMQELIKSTERRIKGEREAMRKEIEQKMLHVSEEFTRSSNLRNAAYTQRLIRENIALEKEISILESTWRATDQQLKEQIARHKEVKATFPGLEQNKRDLILVGQQKTNLIEELTTKYEKIKGAYVESLLYKTKYEELIQYKLCKNFERKELLKQAKKFGFNAHTLKIECWRLGADYERNRKEIESLKNVISLIRCTILEAIGIRCERIPTNEILSESTNASEPPAATNEIFDDVKKDRHVYDTSIFAMDEFLAEINEATTLKEEEEAMAEEEHYKRQSQNLLATLFQMLQFYKMHKTFTTSLQTIPYDDFLKQHSELIERSSASLREEFKRAAVVGDVCKVDSVQLQPATFVKQTIPKERPERCQVFDVEKGTSLYVSQSDSNKQVISVHEEVDYRDDELEGSSSDYEEPAPQATTNAAEADAAATAETLVAEKQDTTLQSSLSDMPAGTIFDVEMMEDGEDEVEAEHDSTERDDGDIYFADRVDEQQARDTENTGDEEEDEEEMPIYMFY